MAALLSGGGGKNSIRIIGKSDVGTVIAYRVDGAVRIAFADGATAEVIVVDDGSDDVIVEGIIGEMQVKADNIVVSTNNATIKNAIIEGNGTTLQTGEGTSIENVVVSAAATINNQGTIKNAEIKSNNVVLDGKKIDNVKVDPAVTEPPKNASSPSTSGSSSGSGNSGGGSGGGSNPGTGEGEGGEGENIAVTGVTISVAEADESKVEIGGAGEINYAAEIGDTLQFEANVLPANATNRNVVWTLVGTVGSESPEEIAAIAEISENGLLTVNGFGCVRVKALSQDDPDKYDHLLVNIERRYIYTVTEGTDSYTVTSAIELFTDEHGVLWAPFNFVGEALRHVNNYYYEEETAQAVFVAGATILRLDIGDVSAKVVDGRIVCDIELAANWLGRGVTWDLAEKTVDILPDSTKTLRPSITTAAQTVHTNKIDIHGKATPGAEIHIVHNGTPLHITTKANGGGFSFSNLYLSEGLNTFSVTAQDEDKLVSTAATVNITYERINFSATRNGGVAFPVDSLGAVYEQDDKLWAPYGFVAQVLYLNCIPEPGRIIFWDELTPDVILPYSEGQAKEENGLPLCNLLYVANAFGYSATYDLGERTIDLVSKLATPTITPETPTVNTSTITVTGTAVPGAYITITGGAATATGQADETGVFSITVTLNMGENTLNVTAKSAESSIDTSDPAIVTITYENEPAKASPPVIVDSIEAVATT